jgi:hypothetical protein
MPLSIDTFHNQQNWRPGGNFGGTTLFKALGHPYAADRAPELVQSLRAGGPVAIYDPLRQLGDFTSFYPLDGCAVAGVHVQDVARIGEPVAGHSARPVTELGSCPAPTVFVTAFDADRLIDHVRHLAPAGARFLSFDALRLPEDCLSNRRNYLDPLNFATNFALFRDDGQDRTVLRTANYWSGYGAERPALWLRLFDADGTTLATWREELGQAGSTISIDSRAVRERFALGPFAGSLFVHAIGIRGHDVVKYALDTGGDDPKLLSCTHDANAWPADFYAGVPAPDDDERVVLWIQNSHPVAIPPGAVGVNTIGSQAIETVDETIPPFGTRAIDLGTLLPGVRWPSQIEIRAGRHFVRPRYEIRAGDGRRRIAHANVERTDLVPDPAIPDLAGTMGKGYLLALPILPLDRFASAALPTPMATTQQELPVACAIIDADGSTVARQFLGRVPRCESRLVDVDAWLTDEGLTLPSGHGHVEFTYDFRDGGGADGWLHALGRYGHRASGHVAETSFGAHIFNTPLVYRDEPQSYAGRPPGLSTRLFLRLGPPPFDTMCHLIYPASTPWHPLSDTTLILHDVDGNAVARETVRIPCGGSCHWRFRETFGSAAADAAGARAYVVIRDTTCRLFGYHGLMAGEAAFSLDHMFGF